MYAYHKHTHGERERERERERLFKALCRVLECVFIDSEVRDVSKDSSNQENSDIETVKVAWATEQVPNH